MGPRKLRTVTPEEEKAQAEADAAKKAEADAAASAAAAELAKKRHAKERDREQLAAAPATLADLADLESSFRDALKRPAAPAAAPAQTKRGGGAIGPVLVALAVVVIGGGLALFAKRRKTT